MINDSGKQMQGDIVQDSSHPARTDDLLASGADSKDGARGFADQADPSTLQTGMEGIAGATDQEGGKSAMRSGVATETVQDNPGREDNKQ